LRFDFGERRYAMSQVNVNPGGGPVYDGGDRAAAAGMNLLAVILIIAVLVAIAVVAWGATAGHWFTSSTTTNGGGNTTINVSQPASPASSPVTISTSPSPAASR
jgi:predicted metal-binding membrane protein